MAALLALSAVLFVIGIALASLALAAALLRFGWPALLLAFLFGAGAAVLDLQKCSPS